MKERGVCCFYSCSRQAFVNYPAWKDRRSAARPAAELEHKATIGGSVSDLSSNDLQAIVDIHRRWMDAELAGDSLEALRFCTDDVVWIPPDSPILEGREAITRWLKGTEVEIISIEVTDLRIGGSGSVAYKTGNYTTAYKAVGSSEVSEVKGTHVWILQKTGNDEWRVAIVTWSSIEAN